MPLKCTLGEHGHCCCTCAYRDLLMDDESNSIVGFCCTVFMSDGSGVHAISEHNGPCEMHTDRAEALSARKGEQVPRDLSSDERGSPAFVIALAHKVMGDIDLDPASCKAANAVVNAHKFYTKEQNGLAMPWFGRLWLNPPFSQPLCEQFIDKLLEEIGAEAVSEAMVLVNYSTGKWFHKLLAYPGLWIGFFKHHPLHPNARLEFTPLPGNGRNTKNNPTGQVIFYYGGNNYLFRRYFEDHCVIMRGCTATARR